MIQLRLHIRLLKGIAILLLYVDSIIITSDDPRVISNLQCYLEKSFEMKDLRPLS